MINTIIQLIRSDCCTFKSKTRAIPPPLIEGGGTG